MNRNKIYRGINAFKLQVNKILDICERMYTLFANNFFNFKISKKGKREIKI